MTDEPQQPTDVDDVDDVDSLPDPGFSMVTDLIDQRGRVSTMSQSELLDYVDQLRSVRSSAPTLRAALRKGATAKKKTAKTKIDADAAANLLGF